MKDREMKDRELKKVRYKKRKILCIVLHEGKGSTWYWLDERKERFSINQNTYFRVDDGVYVKGTIRFLIYLEGVSLPIHHGYIERETRERTLTDKETGKEKKVKLAFIKNLKFDSKIIDILLNRHLADVFTKQHMDLPNMVIVILLVISLIIGFANIGMWFL
ncbi:MAG: hypothetical protein ACFFDN_02600 [Candidatus Hodarchaeota archaeon]